MSDSSFRADTRTSRVFCTGVPVNGEGRANTSFTSVAPVRFTPNSLISFPTPLEYERSITSRSYSGMYGLM